jgi:catechol 2,3-dioxygenase-like lactoylglutathione lyase family enzyme
MTPPASIPGLKVLFVAGFGPIVRSAPESIAFFRDTLGLPLEPMPPDDTYLHGKDIEGVKYFALWPLSSAAESCFGTPAWPADVPAPQAWLELDVEDVAEASRVLKERGYQLLVENRREPWGQTVTRLLSPEGVLVGITFTPWMRG